MNNEFNVIYFDEYVYGFLPDLIEMFENEVKLAKENGDDTELIEEAIKEAEDKLDRDDNYYIYKVWYNPMGAFMFKRLKEEEEE